MPSPKTDADASAASRWARFDPRSPAAFFRRLNTRLVFALVIAAVVSLIVSGIAISQILPGYFAEQTEQRVTTSVASVGIDLRQEVARIGASPTGANLAEVTELRDNRIVPGVAEDAARIFRDGLAGGGAEGRREARERRAPHAPPQRARWTSGHLRGARAHRPIPIRARPGLELKAMSGPPGRASGRVRRRFRSIASRVERCCTSPPDA